MLPYPSSPAHRPSRSYSDDDTPPPPDPVTYAYWPAAYPAAQPDNAHAHAHAAHWQDDAPHSPPIAPVYKYQASPRTYTTHLMHAQESTVPTAVYHAQGAYPAVGVNYVLPPYDFREYPVAVRSILRALQSLGASLSRCRADNCMAATRAPRPAIHRPSIYHSSSLHLPSSMLISAPSIPILRPSTRHLIINATPSTTTKATPTSTAPSTSRPARRSNIVTYPPPRRRPARPSRSSTSSRRTTSPPARSSSSRTSSSRATTSTRTPRMPAPAHSTRTLRRLRASRSRARPSWAMR
ncbi:hypothetical protein FA95DRAFT_953955 [Auriscalpium vulgare]|uniref:Uncharacterized protein n=1 Tax=Auriscalpium vulgare TaxID=40419 RepID=A0ACB8R7R8_9AGAM|nr:hypothetical protein FA95DRAFT_953955 [Auriscalpium vulgare]